MLTWRRRSGSRPPSARAASAINARPMLRLQLIYRRGPGPDGGNLGRGRGPGDRSGRSHPGSCAWCPCAGRRPPGSAASSWHPRSAPPLTGGAGAARVEPWRRAGRGAGSPRAQARQGSITRTPQSSKSAALRVASAAPRERAMAAICASACAIGLPIWRPLAAIMANSRAAARSNGRTRPARSASKIASTVRGEPNPPASRRQQRQAREDFRLGDRRCEQAGCRLRRDPRFDRRSGPWLHQLGEHVGVEHDHHGPRGLKIEDRRLTNRIAHGRGQLRRRRRVASRRRIAVARSEVEASSSQRSRAQDLPGFLFHRAIMLGRTPPEPRFDRLIEVPDGDAGHSSGSENRGDQINR